MASVAQAAVPMPAAEVPETADSQAGDKITFPGNDGKSHRVTWDKQSFYVDGERLHVWSGELHHWRLPSPEHWRDVFQKLRASGFNAVSLYFFHGLHQSEENGPYDFTGIKDIDKLLTIAEEEGLYVIVRPGPYVNAEISMGGLPAYMSNYTQSSLRSVENLDKAKEWLGEFNKIAKRHQITDGGGSIILYQAENELYSDVAWRGNFLRELTRFIKSDGITVPVFHNDWGMGGRFADVANYGTDFYAFDWYPAGFNCGNPRGGFADRENDFRRMAPNSPMFITEAQGGAFTPWGAAFNTDQCAVYTDGGFTREYGVVNLGNGVTAFNYYMIIGGTNWGWTGSPSSGFTSYDYGAALNEDRIITPKLGVQKELGYWQNAVPQYASMDPVTAPRVAVESGRSVKAYERVATDKSSSATGEGTHLLAFRHAQANTEQTTNFTTKLHLSAGQAQDTGTVIPANDSRVAYTGTVTDAAGGVKVLSSNGATATLQFTGSGIEVTANPAVGGGSATVTIDSVAAGNLNTNVPTLQNAEPVTVRKSFGASGTHTVVVRSTGTAPVNLASFRVFGADAPAPTQTVKETINDNSNRITYSNNWEHANNLTWTQGDIDKDEHFSKTVGAYYEFTFTGTGIEIIAPFSVNHGYADVFIDEVKVGRTEEEVTTEASAQQVVFSKKDLENKEHKLKVVVTGERFAGSSDHYVSVDALRVYEGEPSAPAPTPADAIAWDRIPQKAGTFLTLNGRDAVLVTADLKLGEHKLYYSTSQLFVNQDMGDQQLLVLVGKDGQAGEVVLAYDAEPTVSGTVDKDWNATRKELRLNFNHGTAPQEFKVTAANGKPLVIRVIDRETAADAWLLHGVSGTTNKPIYLEGAYLARSVKFDGANAAIWGSADKAQDMHVVLPQGVTAATWNGEPLQVANGVATGRAAAPVEFTAPTLQWVKAEETPEAAADFDDASWRAVDKTTTVNRWQTPGANSRKVMSSNAYHQFEGDVWYRGKYTPNNATGTITVNANGSTGQPGHGRAPAFALVWVNGQYAGSVNADGRDRQVRIPDGAVTAGEEATISILVHNMGQNLDWSDDGLSRQSRGLADVAVSNGTSSAVTWKIQGAQHTVPVDVARGLYNVGGLYGERAGWYLPGYPTSDWKPAATMNASKPGVAWYRSSFDLDVPAGQDVAFRLEVQSRRFQGMNRNDKSQVLLFVNGWNTGVYVGDIGPQTSFTIPSGFLNMKGKNEIAVAVTAKETGHGPDNVVLRAVGNTTGAIAFTQNDAPAVGAFAVTATPSKTDPKRQEAVRLTVGKTIPQLAAGTVAAIRVDWGDGMVETITGDSYRHVYTTAGAKAIRVDLVDNVSGQVLATANTTVTVSNEISDTPALQEVRALAPTKTDLCGTDSDSITIPEVTGVEYRIDGTKVTGTVATNGFNKTVTAVATAGYELIGTASWEFTFPLTNCVAVTPEPVEPIDLCGHGADGYLLPEVAGLTYKVAGSAVEPGYYPANGPVTVTLEAKHGFKLSAGAQTSLALNFTDAACPATKQALAQSGMTATADSQQPQTGREGPVRFLLDGNPATFWHTPWGAGTTEHPHWVKIKVSDAPVSLAEFTWQQRPNGNNGAVKDYAVFVSTTGDADDDFSFVKAGQLAPGTAVQTVDMGGAQAKYVMIVAFNAWTGPWTTGAEFTAKKYEGAVPPPPTQQPSQSSTPTQQPSQSSTPTQQPSQSSTPTQQPSQSSTPTQQPSQSSTPTQQPSQSSTPTQQPSQSSTPTQQPSQSSTPTQQPSQSSTPTQQPSQSSTPTQQPSETPSQPSGKPTVTRLGGMDRYQTAVEVLKASGDKAETVVLVSGEVYADALAAGSLAGALEAPLLLTGKASLPKAVKDGLVQAGTRNAYVLGGEASVSRRVVSQLEAEGIRVTRIAGADRFETARNVARTAQTELMVRGHAVTSVLVADGTDFADGLAAGAAAASTHNLLLLSNGKALPKSSADFLRIEAATLKVYGVGGKASNSLANAGVRAVPVVGANRADTAAKLASAVNPKAEHVLLVNGTSPWDALTAGGLAGNRNAVLLLTNATELPKETAETLKNKNVSVTILGLERSVSARVHNQVRLLLK
ncbi:beta-galactosidase [Buchananella felis]|uniref:beta-galactosidase n=1 Tax=Buchananella felis TaxID=3231492 RepID=UPI003527A12A